MSNSIGECVAKMKWGEGGFNSWKEMEDYWKDNRAWKSDELTVEQCIEDVRFLIANFKTLKEEAELVEEEKKQSILQCIEIKAKLDNMGIVTNDGATWQDRVWFEKDATKKRIEKLEAFMKTPGLRNLSRHTESLMYAQVDAMRVYVALLEARLARSSLEEQLADMPAG